MIRRMNTKFINVSLTECDLPSMSIKLKTAKTNPANNIIQPAIDAGIKNIPILLNQGKFILVSIRVSKLIISELIKQ
jgi:hypothetical protein